MEERHLHCSLRTSLQLRRINWGNKGLLCSLWPMVLRMPREGVLWPLLPITYPDRVLSVKRRTCGMVPAVLDTHDFHSG